MQKVKNKMETKLKRMGESQTIAMASLWYLAEAEAEAEAAVANHLNGSSLLPQLCYGI